MCPACLATAAWLIASTASAGGLGAYTIKKLRAQPRPDNQLDLPKPKEKHHEPHSTPPSRLA